MVIRLPAPSLATLWKPWDETPGALGRDEQRAVAICELQDAFPNPAAMEVVAERDCIRGVVDGWPAGLGRGLMNQALLEETLQTLSWAGWEGPIDCRPTGALDLAFKLTGDGRFTGWLATDAGNGYEDCEMVYTDGVATLRRAGRW